MDASQITKLLQKQNTRYINRCQTVDASTLIWKNQIQSSKYIKGVKTCEGDQNTSNPANPACSDGQGICSFGGAGRTSAIQTGSPQQFLNVLSGAAGSASQVYSSESILLQQAGKQSCGVAPTNPAPTNSYVVLPACYCVDTNGPTNSSSTELSNPSVPGNSTITGNPNNLPINNQSNPYLPPFDTYYRFKNPAAQCQYPIQDQNQKHFVKRCFQCPGETGYAELSLDQQYVVEPTYSLSYIGPSNCLLPTTTFTPVLGAGTPTGGVFSISTATPQQAAVNPITGVVTVIDPSGGTTTYTVTYTVNSASTTATILLFLC
jgi:hypothetical protein